MRLLIKPDNAKVSLWAAQYVAKKINEFKPTKDKPYFVLGLPTGATPLGMYEELVRMYRRGKVSFKNVKTFNMDEYEGLDEKDDTSYAYYMKHNLFDLVDIAKENVNLLNGLAGGDLAQLQEDSIGGLEKLQEECDEYEMKIEKAGGVDLFIGGIGADGHIAFNEPGSSLVSKTRVKTLNQETIDSNAHFFGKGPVPKRALTVGVGTVMAAREVMILITGAKKAFALHKAIEEGVSHMWTVSAFQQHPHTMILCDEAATVELKVKTYKYFKDLMVVHDRLNKVDDDDEEEKQEEVVKKAVQNGTTNGITNGKTNGTNGTNGH